MANKMLNAAIAVVGLVGAAAAGYVVFTAASGAKQDTLKRFAVGQMQELRFLKEPPGLPTTTLASPDGSTTLPALVDRVTLVNLWATWCAPCVAEMPSLDRLEAKLGSDAFQVIPVSLDPAMKPAQDFYTEKGLEHLPFYHDQTLAIGRELGAIGLPITVLYGPDGVERARLNRDAEWDSPEAIALIEALIAESGVGAAAPLTSPSGGR